MPSKPAAGYCTKENSDGVLGVTAQPEIASATATAIATATTTTPPDLDHLAIRSACALVTTPANRAAALGTGAATRTV